MADFLCADFDPDDFDTDCGGGDIFACLTAFDCLTSDPFDCCCL